jgi:hypothetical protein
MDRFNTDMPELRVRRDDPATCKLFEDEDPRAGLADGEARLLVERFALSANNVTYAVYGDRLGYWRFFPAPADWGRVPAWGYARVVASRAPELAEGGRVVGLVPMGTRFTVAPKSHRLGFTDASPHRAELSPVYNHYVSIGGEGDDAELVMRPLFTTSVLLDLVLTDAETVVLTSASSKTAYGLAHLLRERSVRTIGLTSAQRTAWVESLGLYDLVLAYDRIEELDPEPAILVDFAGDRRIVRAVHEQAALERSLLVGFTHRDAVRDDAPIPGPKPEFFFAPDEIPKRGAELARRYAEAWPAFAPVVERAMRIERIGDGHELERVWRALVAGRADPAAGYVVSL